jgi:hypothetical protein
MTMGGALLSAAVLNAPGDVTSSAVTCLPPMPRPNRITVRHTPEPLTETPLTAMLRFPGTKTSPTRIGVATTYVCGSRACGFMRSRS